MPRQRVDLDALCREHGLNRSGRRVLQAILADPTMSGRQIARLTRLSPATVCRWLKHLGLRRALIQAGRGSAIAHLPSAAHLLMKRALGGDSKALHAALKVVGLIDPPEPPWADTEVNAFDMGACQERAARIGAQLQRALGLDPEQGDEDSQD